MAKIRVEIEVPTGKYCDNEETVCPMCTEALWGGYYCALFGDNLEEEIIENHYYSKRCEKCKAAEIKDTTKNCKECDHRYGNTCNLFDRELTSYGNVIDDNWGYIRCDECKQAEVDNHEDKSKNKD